MDPRRFLILAVAGLGLGGCAILRTPVAEATPARVDPATAAAPGSTSGQARQVGRPPEPSPPKAVVVMAPIPDPSARPSAACAPRTGAATPTRRHSAAEGRTAIAAANLKARETSRADAFVGGVQVFAYTPGRVYEVWTAPLRVTTLTLAPGETIVSKAAGDTVRWQIGETSSGEGALRRAHVMVKPLERGLETNLVLATSQRVYLVQLRSGPPESFNAAVAWDMGAVLSPAAQALTAEAATPSSQMVTPAGPLDARFRISPRGRRPPWTPTAAMTDGVRTFLTFSQGLASREAPVLVVLGADGERQVVNYRQQGGLWVVDRVFDAAELRLGDRRPQVVRIIRTARDGGPP